MEPSYQSDFFVVRTPLLPYVRAMEFLREVENNPVKLSQLLQSIFSDALIQEAIYVSSPSLYYQIGRYLNHEIEDKRIQRKVEVSLFQYYMRMCSRSTPFGLLAGFSPGTVGRSSKISLKGIEEISRHLRFDMDSLCKIISILNADPVIKEHLLYTPNSSIYHIGSKIRYIEYSFIENQRKYNLQELESSKVLKEILVACQDGCSYGSIIDQLMVKGYDFEESEQYVEMLIANQVFVSELDGHVSCKDYLEKILNIMGKKGMRNELIAMLENNHKRFRNINAEKDKVACLDTLSRELLNFCPFLTEGKIFQMDLEKKVEICELDIQINNTVLDSMSVLKKLYNYNIRDSNLELFKRAFEEKFETATVRLTEALDTEVGLEFKSLSIKDHYRDIPGNHFNQIMRYKLDKYINCLRSGEHEVVIHDTELQDLPDNGLPMPDSFSVTINLLKDEKGDVINLRNAGGVSGVNLLSRFSYTNESLLKSVRDHTAAEQALVPEKIMAEIIHLPQSRTGNILVRPELRDYEIPYLANSDKAAGNKISINDLYLKLSNDRLILFSKKLNKEVIPKLTCAHNYTFNSLPIYRFLCELQCQGIQAGYTWNWGVLEDAPYLPRVTYKRTILSAATWNIQKHAIRGVLHIKDEAAALSSFTEWRKGIQIPHMVFLVESDNELLLNLENAFCVQFLIKHLSQVGSARLQEVLWNEEMLAVTGCDGAYTNEIVIPFVRSQPHVQKGNSENDYRAAERKSIKRKYRIGSEWLYFKIHTPEKSIDKILINSLSKLTGRLLHEKAISRWFFLRYADPQSQIRLRLHLTAGQNIESIIKDVNTALSPYTATGVISEVSLHTYNREIERYGPGTIDLSEQIFHYDSELCCKLLKAASGNDGISRELINLTVVDSFLDAAKFSDSQKLDFYKSGYDAFYKEFNLVEDKPMRNRLHLAYRENSPAIDEYLCKNGIAGNVAVGRMVKRAFLLIDPWMERLVLKTGSSVLTLRNLLLSHIHMHCNRFFETDRRMEECKMYCYMFKFYSSKVARSKVAG